MQDFRNILGALGNAAAAVAPLVGGKPAQAATAAAAIVDLYNTVRDTLELNDAQVADLERDRDAYEAKVLAHLDRTAANLADD